MITFIVNPRSGGGKVARKWAKIEKEITLRFTEYTVCFTKRPMHAAELTREQLHKGVDLIVAVGGDGTLNEVVNGFFENKKAINKNAVLSMLCFGTGADFIRTISWPKNYIEALDRLKKLEKRKIDVGWGEFETMEGDRGNRYFINVAEYGIGGQVVHKVNCMSKMFGSISFLWAIFTTLLTFRNRKISFQCDEDKHTQVLQNTIVANGSYFGGGLRPAPNAQLNSGKLNIVTFGDVGIWKSITSMPKLRKGEHLSLPEVTEYHAQKIVAESESEVLIDMDGEMVGRLPATIEIIPQSLYLCV